MSAAHRVVFPARRHVKEGAVAIQLEAIGRDLALRDGRPETECRIHEHSAVRCAAQSAACRACADERLHQNGHRRVRGIQIVRRHVAQHARGPERRPARSHRREQFRLLLDSQIAFELTGEARAEAVFDERRRSHDDERARTIDEGPPGFEERLEDSPLDRLFEQPQLHGEGMLPGLRGTRAGKGSACRCFEPQSGDLMSIRVGGKAESVRNRQARQAKDRLVGGLGPEHARISRLASRNYEHANPEPNLNTNREASTGKRERQGALISHAPRTQASDRRP